jgi:hypothetical protein
MDHLRHDELLEVISGVVRLEVLRRIPVKQRDQSLAILRHPLLILPPTEVLPLFQLSLQMIARKRTMNRNG